ncbi:centriolin isoform X3 [Pygocentrus nattereri]|uniref:centriolin isoform X3 n=1 Tax=Pygocentrus nattereri TaxID=42514 RepID=UPI0008148B86|nr:centriolin isoform X3 [Pygocentrus nattereri]
MSVNMKRISESHRNPLTQRQRASKRVLRTGSPPLDDRSRRLTSSYLKSASHLDLTGDTEDAAKDALSDDDERKCMGIRYMTEDLIKKSTKQDNLTLVRSLNLSSTHGDKYFRYIENLEKCDRLQVLNLSYNGIEKIEKLERLHKLRELHLSNNRIKKIEGLEHMASLQILNLASNSIEQVPFWLAKKLRSLQTLNLQNNKIFSLHELSRLKLLKNLTELMLADNPVSDLAHYRLFLIFHLRSLAMLDGERISKHEREQAHLRFHSEEVEHLEQELEERRAEIEQLQKDKAAALEELEQQEKLQQRLWVQSEEQQQRQEELERELNTKSELPPLPALLLDSFCKLKQKTSELTRACQKQYELEQELAFHKIDAKFEPIPFYPSQELEKDTLPSESPYIGKARHKRSMLTPDSIDTGDRHLIEGGLAQTESPGEDVTRHAIKRAEERLQQLHKEIEQKEQQILRASEELSQLEEAASQKRVSEAEKEHLRQQLRGKIQGLGELRKEVDALEKQLERHRAEYGQTQGELEQLQSLLQTLDPEDPRHTHAKAQVASKSQLLAIMSRKHRELEGRLDDMLTRITKETQEIKDLEQQLTEGQIAANEALKQDLEGIISGLQEYLYGVKNEARRAQSDCLHLQRERDTLQRLLQDKEQQLSQLQREAVQISESTKEELLQHQEELEALKRENVVLRQAQTQVSAYEAELEAQLRERDTEAGQLKEELGRLRRLSQLEHSALQAELQKERQAKENALAQLQLAAEKELENNELLQQLNKVQKEKRDLMEKVSVLQNDLQKVRRELVCPKQAAKRLDELRRSITKGPVDLSRMSEDGDLLGESLSELQEELHRTISAAFRDRDEAQRGQDRLAHEVNSLRDRLRNYQQKYQNAREEAEQAKQAAERRGEEAELIRLKEELQEAREQQYLMMQRLQEAESERDRLLTELEEQDKQMKDEEAHTQENLQSLDLELRELRRSFTTADQIAAQQLNAAKDQLRSLHSTVQKISQERAEDAEELKESKIQAAQAMQDLTKAEAEIQALQKMLQDRALVMEIDSPGVAHSSIPQKELARLNRALKRQQAQTRRLRDQLAQANDDNSGNLEELLEEIEALRDTLLQQNNYLSSFVDSPHNRGCWYYVPPNQNPPSLGSQGTNDSGLGSQHLPFPDRGRHSRDRQRKETRPSSNTGYWVYSPCLHDPLTHGGRDPPYGVSDGENEKDNVRGTHFTPPPGSVIYTVPPDGTHLPPGTVIYAPPLPGMSVFPGAVFYGPPPDGARLVYGPPPSELQIPLIPNGTLHCNVPGHQDMERSLREAELSLREQRSSTAVSERELLRLEEQRSDLQLELKELQRTVSRLQRHRRLLENSVSRAEEEQCVMGEVECLEKTLVKRRTELREAEHLLLEAEADLKDARAKTKDTLQSCGEAKHRLQATEHELEEIELQTQDSAKQLVHTKQQLRELQEELKDLQKQKQEQENTLQQIEKVIAARDAEFQEVNRNLERTRIKLDTMQEELKETQSLESKLLKSCRDAEILLNQRKNELEHLNTQMLLQQEELSLLGKKLEQWQEEEAVMRESVEKHRKGLVEVLREGEQDVHSLQQRIKDLHAHVQALAVQKGELDSQLSESKSRLAQFKKEEQQEEEAVQKLRSFINKHKAELKHVLEMIQLESAELEGVKVQHNQKVDQLEKSQETLLQVRMEQQEVQEELQVQRERQRKLQEQCTNLEARRTHAQRCLEAAKEGAQAAEAELLKLQAELAKLKQEHRHAYSLKEEVSRDTNMTQQQLEEKTEELNKLKEQVADSQLQLEEIRKEVEDVQRERDDLVKQQREQKAELQNKTEKIQRRQQRVDKLQQQLKDLEVAVAKKETQLEQQEEHMKSQQQQSLELEELQRQQQQKLQSQLQALEGALTQRVEKMEQVTAAVEELEEKRGFLQADQQHSALLQDRVAQLEEELAEREVRLRAKTKEAREVKQDLETCHSELQRLQDTLAAERRSMEAQLVTAKNSSLAEKEKLQQAEKERERLHRELVVVDQAAQENHERARGLQLELSSTSHELLCLKDKLRHQGEGKTRLQEIKGTVRSLRSEVRAELDTSMKELALQSAASTDANDHKENHDLSPLAVRKSTYNTKDEQWRGEALRERLRQHEDHLKAQLRRSVFSQQEVLSLRRQQTEGSIQGLRRRVDRLDQLLGKSSHKSPYPSDSEILPSRVSED